MAGSGPDTALRNTRRKRVPHRARRVNDVPASAARFSASGDVLRVAPPFTFRAAFLAVHSKCNESLRSRLSSKK